MIAEFVSELVCWLLTDVLWIMTTDEEVAVDPIEVDVGAAVVYAGTYVVVIYSGVYMVVVSVGE